MPKPERFQFLGRADDISVVGDESGFELHFSTPRGQYVVNVHGVKQELIDTVCSEIGGYLAEGLAAAREYRPVTDDADAYPADSPKHPAYHSTHADIWDAREKGA